MARPVLREDVQRLLGQGAQLVEVLDKAEYERLHIAGAACIPLPEIGATARGRLEPTRPVVVYCYDALCDLSPRAAARLDSLGFGEVYDYVASKVDWCANGLPCEGSEAAKPRLLDVADRSVRTCRLDEPVSKIRARIGTTDECVVVDEQRVVLGVVRTEALSANGRTAEQVMHEGPTTYRPDMVLAEIARRLDGEHVRRVLVTHANGTLVGLATVNAIRQAAHAAHAA